MPTERHYPIGHSKVIKEMSAVQNDQYYITVAKSNELIRKGCYGLSTVQQKLLCYLIADIKDTDTAETIKEYNLKDIYDFLCVNSNSKEVMKNITAIDKKSWWIVSDTESVRYRFFNTLIVTHDNRIKFSFHETILPYLQNLIANKNYTYYRILYILCMKSEYSIRLYEMLKAAEHLQIWHYDLAYLKEQLDCTDKYSRFGDFKKRVIDPAILEINEQTDITVSYSMYKNPRGHNFDGIEFTITTKDTAERLTAERGLRDKLNTSIENNYKNRVKTVKQPERKQPITDTEDSTETESKSDPDREQPQLDLSDEEKAMIASGDAKIIDGDLYVLTGIVYPDRKNDPYYDAVGFAFNHVEMKELREMLDTIDIPATQKQKGRKKSREAKTAYQCELLQKAFDIYWEEHKTSYDFYAMKKTLQAVIDQTKK